jgi:heparan-alpha-glucosaminide N-acetyltransferase
VRRREGLEGVEQQAFAAPEPATARLLSLDLLRGLVVLLMLFVNQADAVEGAPAFLRHAGEEADAITLADLVFPAFLFMVGMSIPFALGSSLRRDGLAVTVRHLLSRSGALLVMGVLLANAALARADAWLSPPLWGALAVVGALLVWRARPARPERRRLWLLTRAIGALLLVLLGLVYRGGEASGFFQLRLYGWGILGGIGWAYLTAGLVYLAVRDRLWPLLLGVGALNGLYYVDVLLHPSWVVATGAVVGLGGLIGSQGAVALAGVALGVVARRHTRAGGSPWPTAAGALALALALLAAGWLLHLRHADHFAFAFHKDEATPPWGLVSAAATAAAWLALFVAADGLGWRRWPPLLAIAGRNALLVYLLEPLTIALLAASAPLFGSNPWTYLLERGTGPALLAGALFACLVSRLAGGLASVGLRLRL